MQMSLRAGVLASCVATVAMARSLQANGELSFRYYDLTSCFTAPDQDFISLQFPSKPDLCDERKTCFCATGQGVTKLGKLTGGRQSEIALQLCFTADDLEVKVFKGTSTCGGSPVATVQLGEQRQSLFAGECLPIESQDNGLVIKAIEPGELINCAGQRLGVPAAGGGGDLVLPFRGGDGYFDLGMYDNLGTCESIDDRQRAYKDPSTIKTGTLPDRKFPRCDLCRGEDLYPELNPFFQVRYTGSFPCQNLWEFGLKGGVDDQLCGPVSDDVRKDCACTPRGGRKFGFRFEGEVNMCDTSRTSICVPGTDVIVSGMRRALQISLRPNAAGIDIRLFDGASTCAGSPAAVFSLAGSQVDDFINGKCTNGGTTGALYVVKEALENIKCLNERLGRSPSPTPAPPRPAPAPPSPTPAPPRPTPAPPRPTPAPPGPTPTPVQEKVSAVEWEHFQLLNRLREEGHTCDSDRRAYGPYSKPLVFSCRLWRAARAHSLDMMTNDFFSHNSRNGSTPWFRVLAFGTTASAENIHAGRPDAAGSLESLKKSLSGHCPSLMGSTRQAVGIGHTCCGGTYRNYWTQLFRDSADADEDTSCYPDAPTPVPAPRPVPSPTPMPPAGGPTLSAEERAFFGRINYLRCLHGSPELPWKEDLASSARRWSTYRTVTGGLSRNALFFFIGLKTIEQSIDQTYGYGANELNPKNGWRQMYFNILWKDTTGFGCGMTDLAGGTVGICFFSRSRSSGSVLRQVGPVTKTDSQCARARSAEDNSLPAVRIDDVRSLTDLLGTSVNLIDDPPAGDAATPEPPSNAQQAGSTDSKPDSDSNRAPQASLDTDRAGLAAMPAIGTFGAATAASLIAAATM